MGQHIIFCSFFGITPTVTSSSVISKLVFIINNMIENIKACKGRKSLENIELRNVQSQNFKHLSSDHRLFWVENSGNWEKMNAAQSIDCPIVDIIQGSTKAVEFQWDNSHGKFAQDSHMLHSKEVIENQFQPSIANGYDGTHQIADATTTTTSSSQVHYEGNSLCICMPFLIFSVFIALCYIKSLG